MTRTVLVAGLTSFLMSFLGGLAALSVALPTLVSAQEARSSLGAFAVVREDGLIGLTADVRPTGGGVLQVLGSDGATPRIQIASSGLAACPAGDSSPVCQGGNAGVDVRYANGDLAVRLGLLAPDLVPVIRMVDGQGKDRLRVLLDSSGSPSIQMFDEDGNLTWAAP